jgi:hypothetical protein
MSSIISNFVTVQKKTLDVLPAPQYRSTIEAIQALLKHYKFKEFKDNYTELLRHIVNYSTPHHEDKINFFDEIVSRVYNIYINMLSTPLSLDDFKTTIVPTPAFVELIRRIVLNRYLYDQVKLPSGKVTTTAAAYLNDEWGLASKSGLINLSFGENINSEVDFIKLGWNGNTTPIATIFSAESLLPTIKKLPVFFETSSASPSFESGGTAKGFSFPLDGLSNDFTVDLKVRGYPFVTTTLLTLRNQYDVFTLDMDNKGFVTLYLDGVVQCKTLNPVVSGNIQLSVTGRGYVFLNSLSPILVAKQKSPFWVLREASLTTCEIGIEYENLFKLGFGLRELTFYSGYSETIPDEVFTVPNGQSPLFDAKGNIIYDPVATPLTDTPPNALVPYNLVIDEKGNLVQNETGTYVVDPVR